MKKRILTILFCALLLLLGMPHAEASSKVVGDANCDGSVTVLDASLILRYTVGLAKLSSQGLTNADANWDDKVNAADAAVILRYAVKLASLPKSVDEALDGKILIGTTGNTSDWSSYANAITQFIKALPTTNPYRAVLYKGADYLGEEYNKGTFDCSIFVRKAFHESGNSANYPSGSTQTVISTFKSKYPQKIHEMNGMSDASLLKPGYVLGYVDSDGKGNHVSLYVGYINGKHFVMEASFSAGGAYIRELWDWGDYHLKYYMTPLD